MKNSLVGWLVEKTKKSVECELIIISMNIIVFNRKKREGKLIVLVEIKNTECI